MAENKIYEDSRKSIPYLKLYIYLFNELTKHYNELPDHPNQIPQKELHRIMDKDLKGQIQELTDNFNLILLENATKAGKTQIKNPYTFDEVKKNVLHQAAKAFVTFTPK